MRAALDGLYRFAFWLAAGAFAAIALLVLAQIAGRLLDRGLAAMGQPPLGLTIPSLAEFGAFLFAAAAFLALPETLRRGGHVRVTILAQRLGGRAGRAVMAAVTLAGLGLGLWAAWHMGLQAIDAAETGAVSYGVVAIPLAIPQAAAAFGLALLATALADALAAIAAGRDPAFRAAERAREERGDADAAGGG